MIYIRDEGDIRNYGFNFYPRKSTLLGFIFWLPPLTWFFYYNKKSGRFFNIVAKR